MHPGEIKKTDFWTHQEHYEFLVMRPLASQMLHQPFKYLWMRYSKTFLKIYLFIYFFGDILIYSQNWQEHMDHLHLVFNVLKINQLRIKLEKCQFGKEEVQSLGHIISKQGVATPLKLKLCYLDLSPRIQRQWEASLVSLGTAANSFRTTEK